MQGFKNVDAELLQLCTAHNWQDGAAAVAVWVVAETVLVANVGDAKCVLARRSDKVAFPTVLELLKPIIAVSAIDSRPHPL